MKRITKELLNSISEQAKSNPRLRMNFNMHESMDDDIHRLLNAIEPDTYLPPHRHPEKDETYIVLRGSLFTYFFDDEGKVIEKVKLSPQEGSYGLEIPANTWHSIVVLEPDTVIFEIKKGPYAPLPPQDFAPWAPEVSDTEGVKKYIDSLLKS